MEATKGVKISRQKVRKAIQDEDYVRVKRMGHVTEIMTLGSPPSRHQTTRKLSKDQYLDLRTGEICDYKHLDNRSDDMRTVRRSIAQGRDMINANVDDPANCRWLTLTYKSNMKDPKILYRDYYVFRRRLQMAYGSCEYICAAEPQGRGAWHLHVILIYPGKAPYLDPEVISRLWGKGFVKITALDDIDNVGAYLSAYLMDLPGSEEGEKRSNKKGARLHMYPPGMHIFRWSKGCKKPDVQWMRGKEVKKMYANVGTLTYERGVLVQSGDYQQSIEYRYYNSKRRANQEGEKDGNRRSDRDDRESMGNDRLETDGGDDQRLHTRGINGDARTGANGRDRDRLPDEGGGGDDLRINEIRTYDFVREPVYISDPGW